MCLINMYKADIKWATIGDFFSAKYRHTSAMEVNNSGYWLADQLFSNEVIGWED